MSFRLPDTMPTVFLAAKILSAATLIALLAALVNLWRRPSVSPFSYGAVTLSQRRLKGLWFAFLLGALVVASNNDPVARNTRDTAEPMPAPAEAHPRSIETAVTLPFPFYHYKRTRRWVNGAMVEEHIEEGVALPWSLLWALLAYYVLVVHWNPDSRWAKRILEGRKGLKRANESGLTREEGS